MKFTIITPTTGDVRLRFLLASINKQELPAGVAVEHIIVVDGPKFQQDVDEILTRTPPSAPNLTRFIINLPFNTGAGGFFGHKIYAGISQLVSGDYIIMMDEDNYLQPDHISSFFAILKEKPYDWLYCLRRIVHDAGYVCDDNCESLGYLMHVYYNQNDWLIDTACYCVSRAVMTQFAHVWNRPGKNDSSDPDRIFGKVLMAATPNYRCTKKYTVNYRIAHRTGSVNAELFQKGNQIVQETFGEIPWTKPDLFLIHFSLEQTNNILQRLYTPKGTQQSVAYHQWNLNMADNLMQKFHLLNGYSQFIPSHSIVLFHLYDPSVLPKSVMERTDLFKIAVTIESPNVRHKEQWDLNFLKKYFNHVVTYWTPLFEQKEIPVTYFPFVHRLNFENPNDLKWVKDNPVRSKQVCMILEKRSISGSYAINGNVLQVLDPLRVEYAHALGKRLDCYGNTWKGDEKVNFKPSKDRFANEEAVVDIMKNYAFCLILENCDADGYVSEKIFDAFAAGCIPLYYGNIDEGLKIPADCYVDLKKIPPTALPTFLDELKDEEIEKMKKNVCEHRMAILKQVSVDTYAKKITELCSKLP
jgi:glycosyltransferase involved in cell wall biosynthesis